MTVSDVDYLIEKLGSPNPTDRVRALQAIIREPIASPALLTATEKLLHDRELCVLQIPYLFGEIRIIAAEAVAAIRVQLGIKGLVEVPDAFPALKHDDVARLAEEAGLDIGTGNEGTLAALRTLLAMGRVPTRTIMR